MKIMYGCLSVFFLGLSFVGVAIPGLPATPFIFLTVFFAMRSSEKLTNYIKSLKIYKEHLEPFQKHHAMTQSSKNKILWTATSMIMIPIIIVDNWFFRIFLMVIILVKHIYFRFFMDTLEEWERD